MSLPLIRRTAPVLAAAVGLAGLAVTGTSTPAAAHRNASPVLAKTFTDLDLDAGTAALGHRVVFAAQAETGGTEPFVTDGTAAGTRMLRDVLPGANSSSPGQFTRVGSRVYFVARTAEAGRELWVTDGTTAGTRLVEDVRPGPDSSLMGELTAIGDRLVFTASDGVHGSELWTSRGTTATTTLVEDLTPGAAGTSLVGMTGTDGVAYARATMPGVGTEVLRTDGTDGGTQVIDVVPGVTGVDPGNFVHLSGNTVVFVASTQPTGYELWRSSGSAASTALVEDGVPGPSNGGITGLTRVGSSVFYSASAPGTGQELYATSGTAATTGLVRDLSPGATSSDPMSIVDAGGRAYLTAVTPGSGRELFRSDGTASGTVKVEEIGPGADSGVDGPLVAHGRSVSFGGDDGVHGREPWLSNGTAGGTDQVRDVVVGGDGTAQAFTAAGSRAVYRTLVENKPTLVSVDVPRWFSVDAGTPTIVKNGRVRVGSRLTAKAGTWEPGTQLAYRWLRDGEPVKGATGKVYRARKADRGSKLRVRVTGSLAGHTTVVKVSPAVKVRRG